MSFTYRDRTVNIRMTRHKSQKSGISYTMSKFSSDSVDREHAGNSNKVSTYQHNSQIKVTPSVRNHKANNSKRLQIAQYMNYRYPSCIESIKQNESSVFRPEVSQRNHNSNQFFKHLKHSVRNTQRFEYTLQQLKESKYRTAKHDQPIKEDEDDTMDLLELQRYNESRNALLLREQAELLNFEQQAMRLQELEKIIHGSNSRYETMKLGLIQSKLERYIHDLRADERFKDLLKEVAGEKENHLKLAMERLAQHSLRRKAYELKDESEEEVKKKTSFRSCLETLKMLLYNEHYDDFKHKMDELDHDLRRFDDEFEIRRKKDDQVHKRSYLRLLNTLQTMREAFNERMILRRLVMTVFEIYCSHQPHASKKSERRESLERPSARMSNSKDEREPVVHMRSKTSIECFDEPDLEDAVRDQLLMKFMMEVMLYKKHDADAQDKLVVSIRTASPYDTKHSFLRGSLYNRLTASKRSNLEDIPETSLQGPHSSHPPKISNFTSKWKIKHTSSPSTASAAGDDMHRLLKQGDDKQQLIDTRTRAFISYCNKTILALNNELQHHNHKLRSKPSPSSSSRRHDLRLNELFTGGVSLAK